jgi:hypothetical protein
MPDLGLRADFRSSEDLASRRLQLHVREDLALYLYTAFLVHES